jgi:hypothetical protein
MSTIYLIFLYKKYLLLTSSSFSPNSSIFLNEFLIIFLYRFILTGFPVSPIDKITSESLKKSNNMYDIFLITLYN